MSHEWIAWAKEEIIALSKIVQEKNAEIERLKAKMVELEKFGADTIVQATCAEERGAREMAAICEEVCRVDVRNYISAERLMQLWREGKK